MTLRSFAALLMAIGICASFVVQENKIVSSNQKEVQSNVLADIEEYEFDPIYIDVPVEQSDAGLRLPHDFNNPARFD